MNKPNTISRTSKLSNQDYKWGFDTKIETDLAPKGLNEEIIKFISLKKKEPVWMLEWRLKAFLHWKEKSLLAGEPSWPKIDYPEIDYQDIYYYAAPVTEEKPKSL